MITEYMDTMRSNGYFEKRRADQSLQRMHRYTEELLQSGLYNNKKAASLLPRLEAAIADNRISAYVAAQQLIEAFLSDAKHRPG
jgi:putative protein kinase ArgK-like GTPase of G3E family